MLLPFILGLAMDPELHEAFLRNPAGVIMTRAELSDTEKEMLLSPNRNLIAATVSAVVETNTASRPPRTPSPPDVVRAAEIHEDMMMLMLKPAPWVYAAQNMTGFYWERKGNTLTLTIHGTRLKGAYTCIEIRNGATRIPGQIGEIQGSPMGETVVITFALPNDVADGTYWVVAASDVNAAAPFATPTAEKAPMSCWFVEIGLGYELRRGGD